MRHAWLGLAVAGWLACGSPSASPLTAEPAGWPTYGGAAAGTRYSPLPDITPDNVDELEVAWIFRTGDLSTSGKDRGSFEATPVLHEDTLYLCSPTNQLFAIDAETGEQRWHVDPQVGPGSLRHPACRGVAIFADERAAAGSVCAVRVLLGTLDARLLAFDAASGVPCPGFGEAGSIDLRRGLGGVEAGEVRVTSPPTLVGDLVAVGSAVRDNHRADTPGGVIRGFDARNGALRWAFDPVAPGTAPLPPGPDGPRYHRGTPNAWSVFSADPERGLLFVPTGNPSNDFYRGGRGEVDYYGSSLLALDAATGQLAWHFQTVHHDLWDYDVGSQPTLLELSRGGRTLAAVAQPTKVGHVFVLDRETGEPLDPVEERPVPVSDVPGEHSAPTQPFPTLPPPLHPGGLTSDDVFGLTPIDRAGCRRRLAELRSEGSFTPPSLQGSLQYPGVAGGANWGSAAWDPERGLLVLVQTRLGTVHRLIPRDQLAGIMPNPPAEILFRQRGSPYALLQTVFLSDWGIPCSPPPWSTLVAIDLAAGRVAWEVPLGTTRGQAPWPFWLRWGTPGMGGPIATAGGVIFVGAAMDGYLRAIDARDGRELWSDVLPAGGQATPMTYRTRAGGRQYLVIAAGGHSSLPTEAGDYVIAYALPE